MATRGRILFVAMHTSVHAARWINLASAIGYDVHVFPVDAQNPHYLLRNLTVHVPTLKQPPPPPMSTRAKPSTRLARLVALAKSNPREALRTVVRKARGKKLPIVDLSPDKFTPAENLIMRPFFADEIVTGLSDVRERERTGRPDESDATALRLHGPAVLAATIRELKPDLVHSMEFQHAGYLTLAARDIYGGGFPPWLATNWGSDIFYYGRFPDHARQIRRLCEAADLYSCECHRDLALGRQFGYRGPDLPVLANSGGIDLAAVAPLTSNLAPSRRKLIMVKGYDHFAGRAMTSLAVLERHAEELRDYTVVLFSVGAKPRARALELAEAGTLNIQVVDWAPHEEILRYFGQARIYLGVSISDAISTSVLEAMTMGAFPIQTNTSCCDEWFVPGETGFAVPHDDFEEICRRFGQALSDDRLVDDAAGVNLDIIKSRLAMDAFLPRFDHFYAQALGHAHELREKQIRQ